MRYLEGRRAQLRTDPRFLLPSARSVVAVGKLYNTRQPYSTAINPRGRGWISRYAWGRDYHTLMKASLAQLAARIAAEHGPRFEWRAAVDTTPILERAYARRAGLGWIGKNSCLIHERQGSWFFLGMLLVSLDLEPGEPPPDRCGSCRRCIEACPTGAILANVCPGGPAYTVDSRRCISYLTIESRGPIPASVRPALGRHVFGCDVCQEVCPWNRKAPFTTEPAFAARRFAPSLTELAALDEAGFQEAFQGTPVLRAGYGGFSRNVAAALENDTRMDPA